MAANMSNRSEASDKLVNYQIVYDGQVISALLTEEDGEKILNGDPDMLQAVINSKEIEKHDHVHDKPSCSSSSTPINSASTSKTEHSNETTKESDWTPKNTRYLISLVRQKLYTEEGEKLICKSGIWKEISLKLKQNGHIHSSERCRGKWRTLITSYKKISDSNKQSGENLKTHEFFDELSFLDKSADVEPAYILESSKD
ncbi:hypothetical protein LOTGIDRAFT_175326 [Lottia gigantea]|uniref:Myb-like domain-containing protein n=1 Tax=Lottia gigantea TaxID=225164 RepID=V4AMR2_LOTGI|nr:hypothetical protein LOTGIDRAFT_175326 [Lottia gigantea]ESO94886.1 hypothetical protein LOTGIDRAFT_175326 [Lottia gigantea]